jgi:hypothetical protein
MQAKQDSEDQQQCTCTEYMCWSTECGTISILRMKLINTSISHSVHAPARAAFPGKAYSRQISMVPSRITLDKGTATRFAKMNSSGKLVKIIDYQRRGEYLRRQGDGYQFPGFLRCRMPERQLL